MASRGSGARLGVAHLQVVVQLFVAAYAPDLAVEVIMRESAAPNERHPEAVRFDHRVMRDVVSGAEQQREADVAPDVLADDRSHAIACRARARILVAVVK